MRCGGYVEKWAERPAVDFSAALRAFLTRRPQETTLSRVPLGLTLSLPAAKIEKATE